MVGVAEEKILKELKKRKDQSTSYLAGVANIDYNYALKILKRLEKENKVTKISVKKFNFWRLKSG